MGEASGIRAARANEVTATNESKTGVTAICESDGDNWFAEAAPILLGADAGYALHILTGEPESTCYRAVRSGRPSLYLYRKLCWSEQGRTWWNLFMDGCPARWWQDECSLRKRIERAEANLAELGAVIARQLSETMRAS